MYMISNMPSIYLYGRQVAVVLAVQKKQETEWAAPVSGAEVLNLSCEIDAMLENNIELFAIQMEKHALQRHLREFSSRWLSQKFKFQT